MAPLAYEGLVGWRYLLRRKANPWVLYVGLGVFAAGALAVWLGVWLLQRDGAAVSIFGNAPGLPRTLMAAGGGLSTLGACLSLFGVLNTFLTVFSAFSTFMVTIGVAEVILVLGVMNGFQGDLRAKIIDTYAHVVIEPQISGTYLEDYEALAEAARAVSGVVGATPTLSTDVMLSAPTNLAPIVLTGVQRATVGQTSKMPQQLTEGCLENLVDAKYPCPHVLLRLALPAAAEREEAPPGQRVDEPSAGASGAPVMPAFPQPRAARAALPPGLLLGAELRRNLGLWPGEILNVVSPLGELGPSGPVPKSRPFRVAGWFDSGMLEFDTRLGYADLQAVQRFMGLGDVASAIQIRTEDLEQSQAVRDALRGVLRRDLRITDWRERNRNLFSALKLEKVAMFLVLSINILLAAFSITSTLVMTIIERKREIAILMAMGSTTLGILRIFMSQGALTGGLGSLIGATIGVLGGLSLATLDLPINQEVYYISAIPVDVRVPDVVAIILVALLVSLASTIYPALYASKLRPVEGLSAE